MELGEREKERGREETEMRTATWRIAEAYIVYSSRWQLFSALLPFIYLFLVLLHNISQNFSYLRVPSMTYAWPRRSSGGQSPASHRGGQGSNPSLVIWNFVMDKSGAGAGFLRELWFPLPIYIPSASPQSSSLSPQAGTIGQEWPQCQ
jgi:hypothetical protein